MPSKDYSCWYKSTTDYLPTFEKYKRKFIDHETLPDLLNYYKSNPTDKRIFVYIIRKNSTKDFQDVHEVYTMEAGKMRPVRKPKIRDFHL